MTNSTIQKMPLTRVFLLVTALCLALAISAAAPASHARAADSGECVNQAWIQLPPADKLYHLPDSYEWRLSTAIALSKEYAVLVWPVAEIGEGEVGYKAIVGKVSGDSINFNHNNVHTVPVATGASKPSVAINDQGQVVIAVQEESEISVQACQVTGSGDDPSLKCGSLQYMLWEGQAPSVAINNKGWVVLTHEGDWIQDLKCHIGQFMKDISVMWGYEYHYDHGVTTSVAMSGDLVVEVHHNGVGLYNHLYYHVGHITEEESVLEWGKSHRYETDGSTPSVALYGKVVVAMHEGRHGVYYRYGTVTDSDTIEWREGTGGHHWASDSAGYPCVAASDGKLLMNFSRRSVGELYGGVGRVGYGPVCPWPRVNTGSMSHISATGAVSGGNVITPGYSPVTARGVCWSLSQNPTINDSHTSDGEGVGSFTSHLSGLTPNRGYFVRAYATNAGGTGYGANTYFQTSRGTPTATTFAPWFVTSDEAEVSGAVTNGGAADVTDRGLCWSTSANPTTADGHMSAGTGLGGFQEFVSGLEASTTYYLRAYGSNEYGIGYGANISFVTANPSLATVYTADPRDITASSAILGGEVSGQGSGPVIERGVVWDTSPRPNLNNQRAPMGVGPGAFSKNLTGFASENTYYLRAYAINDTGASFGQQKIFTASSDVLPRVITTAPYGETATSALSGGYVTNSGQSPVFARGVCWSTAPNPDLSGPHSEDGDGTGAFHSAITDLNQDFGYYVRAYATNHAGTSYGEEYFFHSVHPAAPTVQTLDYSGLGNDSVTVSGEVVTPGGGPVATRGICWSTSPHPKVTDKVVNAGDGLGQFNAVINGLQAEQVYYARAFATNEYGTAYGHIVHFRATFCKYPCR